jgi:hypothetical protein
MVASGANSADAIRPCYRDVLVASGKSAIQVTSPGRVVLGDDQHRLWAESMPDSR